MPGKSEASSRACVSCKDRKIKCNRKIPCDQCDKNGTICVGSTWNPGQRRRRFPERDLVERIRRYESLLRSSNIAFEPLHPQAPPGNEHCSHSDKSDLHGDIICADVSRDGAGSSSGSRVRTFWDAVKQTTPDDTNATVDVDEDVVNTAFTHMYPNNELLLFGPAAADLELPPAHPNQLDIVRLWQIYLENVEPLLKVTHTPTMQTRLINAVGDLARIDPAFEALMFAIYCVAICSLSENKCLSMFSMAKNDLAPSLRQACHRALQRCSALRNESLDSLTALFLYHVSMVADADPRSLSAALAIPLRMAQRAGLDSEHRNAKCNPLEAELRRRLWWAMVTFDNRLSEMSEHKARVLSPIWDCRPPANVHDVDMQSAMSKAPAEHQRPTEAVFVVMYATLHDRLRHSEVHLSFTTPVLKSLTRGKAQPLEGSEDLDKYVDAALLQQCDTGNSLHLNTILTARRALAKIKLMAYSLRFPAGNTQPDISQRDALISHAFEMMESDTQLMTAASLEGFRWFATMHFPFPAYMHIVKDLRDRPLADHVDKTWLAMSDNFKARGMLRSEISLATNPVFKALGALVIQAWALREKALGESGRSTGPLPAIVSHCRQQFLQTSSDGIEGASTRSTNPVDVIEGTAMFNSGLFGGIDTWNSTSFDFDIDDLMTANGPVSATNMLDMNFI